jgi:hypothetical protein
MGTGRLGIPTVQPNRIGTGLMAIARGLRLGGSQRRSPAGEPTCARMLAIQDRFVSCCGLVESLTFEAYETFCFGTEIETSLVADPQRDRQANLHLS